MTIMAHTIEDMDIEKEQKDNKRESLEKKGLPESEVIEKLKKLGSEKSS